MAAQGVALPSTRAASRKPLVVVGMEDERRIAAGEDVEVVVGAANAALLRERLGTLDPARLCAVYSFGVAGGLDPELPPGTLLLSTRVSAQRVGGDAGLPAASWPADAALLAAARRRAAAAGIPVRTGHFLGSDLEARDNPEAGNDPLHAQTGADIIDNESHIAAKFAHASGLPFLAIRAVSDSVTHPLPPAALIALNPEDGSPNLPAIAWSLIRHPLQLPALLRTAREYRKALDALQAFRRKVGFAGLVAEGSPAGS